MIAVAVEGMHDILPGLHAELADDGGPNVHSLGPCDEDTPGLGTPRATKVSTGLGDVDVVFIVLTSAPVQLVHRITRTAGSESSAWLTEKQQRRWRR